MDFADDVPRIYFPNPCPGAEQDGYLVGWTIGQNTVVAGIVEYSLLDTSLSSSSSSSTNRAGSTIRPPLRTNETSSLLGQSLQEIITVLNTDPIYESLRSYCGTYMHILGKWYRNNNDIVSAMKSTTTTTTNPPFFQLPVFLSSLSTPGNTTGSSSSTNEGNIRSWITMGWDTECCATSKDNDNNIYASTLSTVSLAPTSSSSSSASNTVLPPSRLPKVWSFRYYLLSSPASVPASNDSLTKTNNVSSTVSSHSSSFSPASCIEATNTHIILYQPPNILALEHYAAKRNITPTLHTLGATAVTARMITPSPSSHGSNSSSMDLTSPKLIYDSTLAQLNASMFGYTVIYRRLTSSSSSSSSSSLQLLPPTFVTRIYRYLMYLPIGLFILIRFFGGGVNYILRYTLPFNLPLWNHSLSLYSVSTLARQTHHKLRDFSHWILLLKQMQDIRWNVYRGIQWYPPEELIIHTNWLEDVAARYVLDLGLGVLAALLLVYTVWAVPLVLSTIHTVGQMLHIDVLRAWIDWLMVLPAGLKLNYNAGRKLGGAVLSVIETWEGVTTFLTPFEPIIVAGIGVFGVGGASLLAALASDVLELATLHLYVLYTAFAALHNRQAGLAGALWRLFRGKKHNILRNRVDSNDYDIAQLLLGTLLFTVVFFLFPTTLVYYVFFSSVWMGILIVHGILWWLITALNNIPVGILWRIVDSILGWGSRYVVYNSKGKDAHTGYGIAALVTSESNGNTANWGYAGLTKIGRTNNRISKDSSIPSSNPCRSPDAVYLSLLGMEGTVTTEYSCTRDIVRAYHPGSCDYWCGNTQVPTEERTVVSFPKNSWFLLSSHSTPIGTTLVSPLGEALSIVSQKYSVGNVLRAVLYGERPTAIETGGTKGTVTISGSAGVHKKKEGNTGSTGTTTTNAGPPGGNNGLLSTNPSSSSLGYTGTWKDYTAAINSLADRWCYGYDEVQRQGSIDGKAKKEQ